MMPPLCASWHRVALVGFAGMTSTIKDEMKTARRVTVLGGGSFGTVLANILAENGHTVWLWMRDRDRVEQVAQSRENAAYLPGYRLHDALQVTAEMAACLPDSEIVFVSVPSQTVRAVVRAASAWLPSDVIMVSTAKGIEAEGFRMMSQVLVEEMPNARIGALSGPNLAREIAARFPTATVIASADEALCNTIQETLGCDYLRVYSAIDLYGVQLAGALKNIYAIITGMADALGMGANTRGMLITRSLAEMSRFAVRLGAEPMTFLGLTGVGDLVVTCTSPLSRNYRVGALVGRGKSVAEAMAEVGQVAEGVNTLNLVKQKAIELDIYMPLVMGLDAVLSNPRMAFDVAKALMLGSGKRDVEFSLRGQQQVV